MNEIEESDGRKNLSTLDFIKKTFQNNKNTLLAQKILDLNFIENDYDNKETCEYYQCKCEILKGNNFFDTYKSLTNNNGSCLNSKRKRKKNKKKKDPVIDKRPICTFYLESRCHKGDLCEFRHEGEIKRKMEPCKFYIREGFCMKNERCIYMHNDFPCKFYYTGKCNSIDPCRFSHNMVPEEAIKLLNNFNEKFTQQTPTVNKINDETLDIVKSENSNISNSSYSPKSKDFHFYE